ncbi:MAG: DUF2812 domain-containing protein [Velocimicrobium sp.]
MKKKKRRFEQFLFYDYAGIEAHLAKMARKGWQLEKITPFYWIYHKIKPQELTYTVTYFSEASDFNPEPTKHQHTFHAYCEDSGWQHITQWAQMQIFCSKLEHPIPIETEECIKLDTIHRSMKKNFLPSCILILLISLFQIFIQLNMHINNPIDLFSNTASLCAILMWAILSIYMLIPLIGYSLWYRRSKQSISLGGACVGEKKIFRKAPFALLIIITITLIINLISFQSKHFALIFVFTFIIFLITFAFQFFIKKMLKQAKVSKHVNLILTVLSGVILYVILFGILVYCIFRGIGSGLLGRAPATTYTTAINGGSHTWDIYHDSLPLTVEDLMDVDYDHYSYRYTNDHSFLLTHITARQTSFPDGENAPELNYEIVDVTIPILYKLCFEQYQKEYYDEFAKHQGLPQYTYIKTDDPIWQAQAVYQLYYDTEPINEYLICWETRILHLRFYWTPSVEQINRVLQLLSN